MVVENATSGATPESPISVSLGGDLVTEAALAFGLLVLMIIKPFSEHSCPVGALFTDCTKTKDTLY